MTNTTTARPATTGITSDQPFGFPLQLFAFRRSIEKALTIKPRVQYFDLSSSLVRSSDGSTDFLVKFYLCNNELYAACSCYAAWKAQPCYHVAAAAIDRGLLANSIDQVRQVSEPEPANTPNQIAEPEPALDRFCPQFEIVDDESLTHEKREQAFNWTNYLRPADSQLKEGWLV